MWDWILYLKEYCKNRGEFPLRFNPEQKIQDIEKCNRVPNAETIFEFGTRTQFIRFIVSENQCTLTDTLGITEKEAETCCSYIKLLYFAYRGTPTEQSRPFILAHLAQTLDARIATSCGDSRWISNEENLIHAHRLRALADAVCVGGKTLELDSPKLTVRHVKGHSPQIVVMSQHTIDQSRISDHYAKAWFYSYQHCTLAEIMSDLVRKKIKFLFVEGGAKTVSTLLEHHCVDILQLHISPKLLGSGRNIQLPVAESIDESISFEDSRFIHVGNEIMFEGRPKYENPLA